jgi:hypothetical protein
MSCTQLRFSLFLIILSYTTKSNAFIPHLSSSSCSPQGVSIPVVLSYCVEARGVYSNAGMLRLCHVGHGFCDETPYRKHRSPLVYAFANQIFCGIVRRLNDRCAPIVLLASPTGQSAGKGRKPRKTADAHDSTAPESVQPVDAAARSSTAATAPAQEDGPSPPPALTERRRRRGADPEPADATANGGTTGPAAAAAGGGGRRARSGHAV